MSRQKSRFAALVAQAWNEANREASDAHGTARGAAHCRADAVEAQAVEACVDQLDWRARAAIGMHLSEKAAGARVIRNPRLSVEEAHQAYQQAKLDLAPLLRQRGMLKIAA